MYPYSLDFEFVKNPGRDLGAFARADHQALPFVPFESDAKTKPNPAPETPARGKDAAGWFPFTEGYKSRR